MSTNPELDSALKQPSFYLSIRVRLKSRFKQYKIWIQSRWEGDFCMRNVWRRKVVFKWWCVCVCVGGEEHWIQGCLDPSWPHPSNPETSEEQWHHSLIPRQRIKAVRCWTITLHTHTCYYKTIISNVSVCVCACDHSPPWKQEKKWAGTSHK